MRSEKLPDPGVLLLDKPTELSSFAALSAAKKVFSTRKVGHTGTLDPFASGLLIALVGKATRAARVFDTLEKGYRATIAFGVQTDTDDRTGRAIESGDCPSLSELETQLDEFTGVITQRPPAYSAVHVDGTRAYKLARDGRPVEIPPREVKIHELRLVEASYSDDRVVSATLDIRCSTGTYIRSLARDVALAAGSRAHVEALRRTSIGDFSVSESVAPDMLAEAHRIPLSDALRRTGTTSVVAIDSGLVRPISHGMRISPADLPERWDASPWTLLSLNGSAVALGHSENGEFAYDVVFAKAEHLD